MFTEIHVFCHGLRNRANWQCWFLHIQIQSAFCSKHFIRPNSGSSLCPSHRLPSFHLRSRSIFGSKHLLVDRNAGSFFCWWNDKYFCQKLMSFLVEIAARQMDEGRTLGPGWYCFLFNPSPHFGQLYSGQGSRDWVACGKLCNFITIFPTVIISYCCWLGIGVYADEFLARFAQRPFDLHHLVRRGVGQNAPRQGCPWSNVGRCEIWSPAADSHRPLPPCVTFSLSACSCICQVKIKYLIGRSRLVLDLRISVLLWYLTAMTSTNEAFVCKGKALWSQLLDKRWQEMCSYVRNCGKCPYSVV